MAIDNNKLKKNLAQLPQNKKLIITGFADYCMATADYLRENNIEVFAYASDDIPGVINCNKNNTIYAEKYVNSLEVEPIKVLDFYEAIRIPNALLLIASDHYQELLTELGYIKGRHFIRVNE
jgi:hypothetical protein